MKHKYFNIKLAILTLSCSLFFGSSSFSQSTEKEDFLQTPESVVRGLYTLVTFEPGTTPDIAHFFVLYEASIPGSSRPPMQGIDSYQLIEKDSRWWIVSVINEIPTPDNPVPAILSR